MGQRGLAVQRDRVMDAGADALGLEPGDKCVAPRAARGVKVPHVAAPGTFAWQGQTGDASEELLITPGMLGAGLVPSV